MRMNRRMTVIAAAGVLIALACGPVTADLRAIDGSDNNPLDATINQVGAPLLRAAPADYADGLSAPGGATRPGAREISNTLFNQTAPVFDDRHLSNFVWAWGQFLDHDISLTPGTSPAEPLAITVPTGDPFFDPASTGTQTIDFNRSVYDATTGVATSRQQINTITGWIDASNVYGSDPTRAAALRTFTGGKLNTTADASGDLLPYNTTALPNASLPGQSASSLHLAGDERANENVVLTSLHTLFVREHNRLADDIAAANPTWSDEQIYQQARKIVGAEIQAITYNEFLPALGVALSPYTGYDPTVDASIANEFSTAAYRLGHSMLTDTITRIDETGASIAGGDLPLHHAFFNPGELSAGGGIDPILRGLAGSKQQAIDVLVIDAVRNFLFGPPGAGGFDLVSLNIQRGRDHGLSDYNAVRAAYGLPPITTFGDITSDPILAGKLTSLYGDVNDIDLWVGLLAEDHMIGSSVGETIAAILAEQFEALRDGDRFYYLSDGDFTASMLLDFEQLTLADIIRGNSGITWIQDNVFFYATRTPEPSTAMLIIVGLAPLTLRRKRLRASA